MSNQQVSLQLVKVICRDETGGSFVERFGNDEIALSGIGIDALGTVAKQDPFDVFADFDDNDVKSFDPPRTLLTLAVPDVGAFPKSCKVIFLLAEVGGGGTGHQEATQKAFETTTKLVAAKKDEMIIKGENPEDLPDLAEQIWEAVKKALFGFVVGVIKSGISDDVFPPKDVSVSITSSDFRFPDGSKLSPEESTVFTGHKGKYEVVYFWQIETVA